VCYLKIGEFEKSSKITAAVAAAVAVVGPVDTAGSVAVVGFELVEDIPDLDSELIALPEKVVAPLAVIIAPLRELEGVGVPFVANLEGVGFAALASLAGVFVPLRYLEGKFLSRK